MESRPTEGTSVDIGQPIVHYVPQRRLYPDRSTLVGWHGTRDPLRVGRITG